jgi:hypothetical protein
MAWKDPEGFTEALWRDLESVPESTGALDPVTRRKRVAELEQQLDKLERTEAAMLAIAANEGVAVQRRLDMSPAALLNVRIVRKAVAA